MEIHRPACTIYQCTFLCTADTVAYLFLDWNVKSDSYLPKRTQSNNRTWPNNRFRFEFFSLAVPLSPPPLWLVRLGKKKKQFYYTAYEWMLCNKPSSKIGEPAAVSQLWCCDVMSHHHRSPIILQVFFNSRIFTKYHRFQFICYPKILIYQIDSFEWCCRVRTHPVFGTSFNSLNRWHNSFDWFRDGNANGRTKFMSSQMWWVSVEGFEAHATQYTCDRLSAIDLKIDLWSISLAHNDAHSNELSCYLYIRLRNLLNLFIRVSEKSERSNSYFHCSHCPLCCEWHWFEGHSVCARDHFFDWLS